MANNDINIRVKLEGGDGQSTSENGVDTTTSSSISNNDQLKAVKGIAIGSIAVAGTKAAASIVTPLVGQFTRSPETQRQFDKTSTAASFAIPFIINPLAGSIIAATRITTSIIKQQLDIRDARIQNEYTQSSWTRNLDTLRNRGGLR